MSNLVIDRGNSSFKVAVFKDDELIKLFVSDSLTEEFLSEIIDAYSIKAGILSTVVSINPSVIEFLHNKLLSFYELTNKLTTPLIIDYKTPESLGMDRLAAAVGAYSLRKGQDLLIIDAGTAITIDYVSAGGVYKGGNISPGVDLRFKALNSYTDKLPLVTEDGDIPCFGYNTETAIRSGVIGGIVRELDSYIDEYKKNKNVFAFLTGGCSFYFDSKLKNRIFADGNLVLKGLNEILNYQYD
ncbi:type III pantothenate kinase [Dysgonomonadaceae bacterium PH5-43]|nr:type III pantothenate kinase [Dysgonomonadaceae bacterium PH5-43]